MRFYVIYEIFVDNYHFDGEWMVGYKELQDLAEADRFIEIHKKAINMRNIIGPLFLARSLDKEDPALVEGVLESYREAFENKEQRRMTNE